MTGVISKQIDWEAQVEIETTTYHHIAHNVKTDGLANTRMQYKITCREIEENYEQTVMAASSYHSRKRARVASEAKSDLGDLFQEVVTKILNDRAALVEELKKEEACVIDQAQEYQEEAFATHIPGHDNAAWVTNIFQALAAVKDLLLPNSSWSSLDALLNLIPSIWDSLYTALSGEYQLNRPKAHSGSKHR